MLILLLSLLLTFEGRATLSIQRLCTQGWDMSVSAYQEPPNLILDYKHSEEARNVTE